MIVRKVSLIVALFAAVIAVVPAGLVGAAQAQPSYDALRISGNGASLPYAVWLRWKPTLVTTPDGGAWAFFSATARNSQGAGRTGKLYAAHFDPKAGVWEPATAMPGGEIQFAPTAVVDKSGVVHLVYADRAKNTADSFAVLMYTHTDANGAWSQPEAVSPDKNSGHQVFPSLAIDGKGQIHLLWQDQRNVPASRRANANDAASAAYADVFSSDFADGKWSAAVQVSQRPGPDTNAYRPLLVADGDRLIAMWSVYDKATVAQTATRFEWSTRPADKGDWSKPQTLVDRGNSQIGGQFVDMEPNPAGGAVLVYWRRTPTAAGAGTPAAAAAKTEVLLRRLDKGSNQWGQDISLGTGNRGDSPVAAVASDGTTYVVYNVGSGASVMVGAIALAPNSTKPGPEVLLTQGELGEEGFATVTIGPDNKPWVAYMHGPTDGPPDEIRCLRGANIPVSG